jgi:hypothetical protein
MWLGRKWRFARGIACILDWLFHSEKTYSKPLDRAIYTIFYRLINGLCWSDPPERVDWKTIFATAICQTIDRQVAQNRYIETKR